MESKGIFKLFKDGERLIVQFTPPENSNVTPFIDVTKHLIAAAYSGCNDVVEIKGLTPTQVEKTIPPKMDTEIQIPDFLKPAPKVVINNPSDFYRLVIKANKTEAEKVAISGFIGRDTPRSALTNKSKDYSKDILVSCLNELYKDAKCQKILDEYAFAAKTNTFENFLTVAEERRIRGALWKTFSTIIPML